jgi:hypothetical protein
MAKRRATTEGCADFGMTLRREVIRLLPLRVVFPECGVNPDPAPESGKLEGECNSGNPRRDANQSKR